MGRPLGQNKGNLPQVKLCRLGRNTGPEPPLILDRSAGPCYIETHYNGIEDVF